MAGDGLETLADGKRRCAWCAGAPELVAYHDTEWAYPVDDDRRLFEKISLEGFQAGLSWLTILRKREAFRRAFAGFDFEKVAAFTPRTVERLLQDEGIVRHRGKIESAIANARRVGEVVEAEGSLAAYIWSFEPQPADRPALVNTTTMAGVTTSPAAMALSKDLKRRGFTFVGPTTVHAFLQSMGLVNDHYEGCSVRPRVTSARRRFARPGASGRSRP